MMTGRNRTEFGSLGVATGVGRLARRPMSLGYSRTIPYVSTYPGQAFNSHLAALLDENSASDGDIFPWQFRNAGLVFAPSSVDESFRSL
ncbi:MAG: hypothetical protein EA419_01370 [Wenzhouxiangella sp.]|nr:MAG: hypothetical protein EA419_01370 [Wenzhouxiangella sp.]